jgi:hypothetical protein
MQVRYSGFSEPGNLGSGQLQWLHQLTSVVVSEPFISWSYPVAHVDVQGILTMFPETDTQSWRLSEEQEAISMFWVYDASHVAKKEPCILLGWLSQGT